MNSKLIWIHPGWFQHSCFGEHEEIVQSALAFFKIVTKTLKRHAKLSMKILKLVTISKNKEDSGGNYKKGQELQSSQSLQN